METTDNEVSNIPKDSLQSLLQEIEGSTSFETYLRKHGQLYFLEFIWACNGMRALVTKEGSQRSKQLVTCIYRQYILSGKLSSALSNQTFLKIADAITKDVDSLNIFDEAVQEVEIYLTSVLYSEFLNFSASKNEEIITKSWKGEKCNNQINRRSRCAIIINEDGLPNVPSLADAKVRDPTFSTRPPTDPETFAKELSSKLEALQETLSQQRRNKCSECQKEKLQLQKRFTAELVKAIEDKLIICDTNEDKQDLSESKNYEADISETKPPSILQRLLIPTRKKPSDLRNAWRPKSYNRKNGRDNKQYRICGLAFNFLKPTRSADSISLLSLQELTSSYDSQDQSMFTRTKST